MHKGASRARCYAVASQLDQVVRPREAPNRRGSDHLAQLALHFSRCYNYRLSLATTCRLSSQAEWLTLNF